MENYIYGDFTSWWDSAFPIDIGQIDRGWNKTQIQDGIKRIFIEAQWSEPQWNLKAIQFRIIDVVYVGFT